MFNGLAGFIFGKTNNSNIDGDTSTIEEEISTNPAGREENLMHEEKRSDSLEIVDDEDEWLMVDVKKDERTTIQPITPLDLDLPSSVDASSGESSPTSDERGGWNLTPPPCFTASFQREKQQRGATSIVLVDAPPQHHRSKSIERDEKTTMNKADEDEDEEALNSVLETSNFENLLIEHPSMSVYGRIIPPPSRRRNINNSNVVNTTQGIDQKVVTYAAVAAASLAVVAPKPSASNNNNKSSSDKNQSSKPEPVRRRHQTSTMNSPTSVAEALLGAELSSITNAVVRLSDLEKQQRAAERAYKSKEMATNRQRRANAVALLPPQGNASPRKRRMKNHPAGRCNDRKCQ